MNEMEKKSYIFGAMFVLSNRMQIVGDRFDENITVKQWLLLMTIFRSQNPAPTISEVAEMVGYSRQNVKKMVLILEKQSYVDLAKDKNDARAIKIKLTDKCVKHFESRSEREAVFMDKMFANFDSESIKGLYDGLCKLRNNIEMMESEYEKSEQ